MFRKSGYCSPKEPHATFAAMIYHNLAAVPSEVAELVKIMLWGKKGYVVVSGMFRQFLVFLVYRCIDFLFLGKESRIAIIRFTAG